MHHKIFPSDIFHRRMLQIQTRSTTCGRIPERTEAYLCFPAAEAAATLVFTKSHADCALVAAAITQRTRGLHAVFKDLF